MEAKHRVSLWRALSKLLLLVPPPQPRRSRGALPEDAQLREFAPLLAAHRQLDFLSLPASEQVLPLLAVLAATALPSPLKFVFRAPICHTMDAVQLDVAPKQNYRVCCIGTWTPKLGRKLSAFYSQALIDIIFLFCVS